MLLFVLLIIIVFIVDTYIPLARNVLFCAQVLLIYVVIVVVNKTPFISLDSLDFLSPLGRTIFSRAQRVGDSYFAFPCSFVPSVGDIFPSFRVPGTLSAPCIFRHFPDTYPTHTRYIRICGEYSTNIPRILYEYST